MSTIEKITQLSHRIFNTSVNEQNVARTSNPFAASNFQKNILTEDVFESSKKKETDKVSFTGNLTASSKRIYSTLVGSLGNIGDRFYEGIESIVEFCGRMKEGVVKTWNKIQEIGSTEVSFGKIGEIIKGLGHSREKEIAKMATMDPHTEVKPMLVQHLKALEADMAVAA